MEQHLRIHVEEFMELLEPCDVRRDPSLPQLIEEDEAGEFGRREARGVNVFRRILDDVVGKVQDLVSRDHRQ